MERSGGPAQHDGFAVLAAGLETVICTPQAASQFAQTGRSRRSTRHAYVPLSDKFRERGFNFAKALPAEATPAQTDRDKCPDPSPVHEEISPLGCWTYAAPGGVPF